ncbi:MAG: GNAT family protein [Pseudomonadota bacterium]
MTAWMTTPTLRGAQVLLRPMEQTDADAVVAAAADGALNELFYTAVPGPDEIDVYMARVARTMAAGEEQVFAVIRLTDGRLVGSTRYMRMSPENRRLEIGNTFYAASCQRTGLNTETKLLLLTHAFDLMGCIKVELRTDRFNRTSQRAIERLGAQRDGILRQDAIMPDGRVRDTVCYSILDREWPSVRANLAGFLKRGDGHARSA